MIDDYSLKNIGNNLIDYKKIVDFYANHITLDNIFLESSFIETANLFGDIFPLKDERFSRDSKTVYFILLDDNKIKLKEIIDGVGVRYSCAALSAAFHLTRAGMIESSILTSQKNEICSILPKEYFQIENQVGLILRELHCINHYIYY